MSNRGSPFFVLGAGFGVDAGALVGPIEAESIYIGKYRFFCAYPLVRDLPLICFPDASPPVPVAEVEKHLADAVQSGDTRPIDRLCEELAKADYYLAPALVGWPKHPNQYARFFSDFPSSSFATYNYDAFVEFALFSAGTWSPHDGYGVKVAVDLRFTAAPYRVQNSQRLVLHLHGTYMVYSYEYTFTEPDRSGVQWMERFDTSRFAFDPHSLGPLFYPFERVMAGLVYHHDLPDRIVAPIPDKATGLRADFVHAVTEKAGELVAEAGEVVAIGYAFSPHDKASYTALLDALNATSHPRGVIVSPEASAVVAGLRLQYSRVEWMPVNLGFAAWVDANYPGL